MIDGGFFLIVVGWLITAVPPAEKWMAGRRGARAIAIGIILRQAYPVLYPSASLLELAASADISLRRDAPRRVGCDPRQISREV